MTHVLVLTSDPARPAVDARLAANARAAITGLGGVCGVARSLREGVAAELPFAGIDVALAFDAAEGVARGLPVDVNVVAQAARRKRLLIADMDSTMIGQECIDELAIAAGVGDRVIAITERAMRGELDFEGALRERVALMAGLDDGALETVWRERIRLTPGGRTLVRTMATAGAHCALVSGGFDYYTARVADACGFQENRANRLVIRDGRLTGAVVQPILGRVAKAEALAELVAARGLGHGDALTVGDGANDADMIAAAGLGVAFRAKPALRECADARIDHGDLTALLHLQGYALEEFITD